MMAVPEGFEKPLISIVGYNYFRIVHWIRLHSIGSKLMLVSSNGFLLAVVDSI